MITKISNRALLKLSGNDVQCFLQGQFSNDIDQLKQGEVQLNAYCQHQGKIIALLWVMKKGADFYLSFPADLSEIVIRRLTMFKMMADVTIEEVSQSVSQFGLIDETAEHAFVLNERQSVLLGEGVDQHNLVDISQWDEVCIRQSIAEIELVTSEKFVPQLLNLDIDEAGVSFTKGCYPGQEVVARLHYLGKSKRRLRAFECTGEVEVGDELLVTGSTSAKASGVVVRCVKLGTKSLFLATVEVAYEEGEISLNNAQKTQITRIVND